ncbi:MAG: hypothetical protein IPH84_03550 [Bacteroidales bacterium]|nr:hypothetical protein [Bacteroidales bacterium]
MKALPILLLTFLGLSLCSFSFGQSLTFPNWLQGVYSNIYESNSKNLETLIISKDRVIVGYGFGGFKRKNQENLFKKYKNYRIIEEVKDSTMRIEFIQGVNSILYEFKLQKVYYEEKTVLTYSIKENGIVIKEHNTSCNVVLVKQE